jgi:hypothetical protein
MAILLLGLLIVPPSLEWKEQRCSAAADYADFLGSLTALKLGCSPSRRHNPEVGIKTVTPTSA